MKANPDLFDWVQSKAERDAGITQVLGNTPEWWRENSYRILREQPAAVVVPFTAEDFWRYTVPLIGLPHHHNALGAVWNSALKQQLVIPTGDWRAMEKVKSHARKTPLYQWP